MRKILYSPGFGAGWTSWHSGTAESKRFMLEYQPFIDFLDSGGASEALDHKYNTPEDKFHPLVKGFLSDWRERFPDEDTPYLGGLRDITVEAVSDGAKVRINEYDGSESVEIQGDYEDWL